MQVQWKQLIFKSVVWLAAEILLNFLGIDNLADYSEFIFETKNQHEASIHFHSRAFHSSRELVDGSMSFDF